VLQRVVGFKKIEMRGKVFPSRRHNRTTNPKAGN
jgi:hypothetical protein